MALCRKCGSFIEDDAKFCPDCGAPVENTEAVNNSTGTETPINTSGNTDNSSSMDATTAKDVADNKAITILCYFGIFLLIPYLTKPDSKFVKFHANQGCILLLFTILLSLIFIIPLLGWIIGFVGYIFVLVLFIMGIINVLNGKFKELPLIGKFNVLK